MCRQLPFFTLGLLLAFALTACPDAAAHETAARAQPLVQVCSMEGVVRGEGKPLADVLVSDGCRVARTDAAGRYRLETGPDSGPFVFVTLPSGYWTEDFYVPLKSAVGEGRADFSLRRVEQPSRFDFVFLTDVHLERRGISLAKFRDSLREIGALDPKPAFVWSQGDICLQGGVGDDYVACFRELSVPVRNGPGNHEMMLSHADPRDDFQRLFGPTYYSFDWAQVHFIVLDGNKPIPNIQDYKAVHGAVEGSELAWLRADLAAQPKGRPIVVGIHIPIVTTYPRRRQESPPDAPYWEVTNRDLLTKLFAEHEVRLVLQGHMHENERATVQGVEYVESISISGNWWRSGEGMERGVDGSPRGYRIVSVDGTKISHRYRPSCESYVARQGEFCGLEKPLPPGRPAELVFNAYDAPNGSTAECRIDDGPWQPMPPFPAINESLGLEMPHHFRLLADTATLSPGRHTIDVRVRCPDGTEIRESSAFQIAAESGGETFEG
jgi:UDP-2,3-diacylglucosamine pyrophosphatase LpxH